MTMRRVLIWVSMAGAALWSGCGAARPIKYYQLTMPNNSAPAADASPYPITLLVGPVAGPHLYREDQIVYSSSAESMGLYETHKWAEPPTDMLQNILARELRSSGRYLSVSSLRSNARGDYLLQGRLYDFKEVDGNPLGARLSVEYELREVKSGATVWSHYYTHDEPVGGKDVSAVVAALDRNAQAMMGQVRAGLEQYFSSHPPVAPEK